MASKTADGTPRIDDEQLGDAPGIMVRLGRPTGDGPHPRISAFIWGGKVQPVPTLRYGRWNGAA